MILPLDVQLALDNFGAPEFVLSAGEHDVLQVRVESEAAGAEQVRGALAEQLGVPVSVEEVATGSLPRATFKPRRVE
jgi:phenylacetate-CoA ligase